MPGQELEVTAGLGAFSKKAKPQIFIDGAVSEVGDDGIARKQVPTRGLGTHPVNVRIIYTNQETGLPDTVDKKIEYTVGQANASIALDKMNVLYIGVDNPVTIAASGGGDDRVKPALTGGGGQLIRDKPGHYIARVNSVTDDCKISVMVDGKLAGASIFRVRTVPQAQCMVGGQQSGEKFLAGKFRAQGGVGAGIKDFPFELKYEVVSFTITCDTDEGDIATASVNGNAFSGKAKQIVDQHVKAGKLVTIENLKVRGPDGRVSSAPSLLYYII
jgi:gliding motility-associated protein GldM